MASPSHISLILVAAGSSTRFGRDKQTALLHGKPLFLYPLLALHRHVREIVVVTPPGREQELQQLAQLENLQEIQWVSGGATRTVSVQKGLEALKCTEGMVAIHDAARPLVTAELLQRLAAAAEQVGGAVPGHPVVDTLLKCSEQGLVQAAVSRENTWAVSTPQVFNLVRLKKAYARFNQAQFTDDSQLFMAAGGQVQIVPEASANLKITYPQDLALVESLEVQTKHNHLVFY